MKIQGSTMDFRLFSRNFEKFQSPTMVFQGIFRIFKIPTMGGWWAKLKLYTTFVNVVKNGILPKISLFLSSF